DSTPCFSERVRQSHYCQIESLLSLYLICKSTEKMGTMIGWVQDPTCPIMSTLFLHSVKTPRHTVMHTPHTHTHAHTHPCTRTHARAPMHAHTHTHAHTRT